MGVYRPTVNFDAQTNIEAERGTPNEILFEMEMNMELTIHIHIEMDMEVDVETQTTILIEQQGYRRYVDRSRSR